MTMIILSVLRHEKNQVDRVMQKKKKNTRDNKKKEIFICKFELIYAFIKIKITNDLKILMIKQRQLCHMERKKSLLSLSSSLPSIYIFKINS